MTERHFEDSFLNALPEKLRSLMTVNKEIDMGASALQLRNA